MSKKKSPRKSRTLRADRIEAREFALVDARGRQRASLACGAGGFVTLDLLDGEGRPRLTLQLDDQGHPGLCFFSGENVPTVSIAANDAGHGLFVSDSEGQSCVMLGFSGPQSETWPQARPIILVIDAQGNRHWSVFEGVVPVPTSSRRRKSPKRP